MVDRSWEEEDDWDVDEDDDDDFVIPIEQSGTIGIKIGKVKRLEFDYGGQL